MEGGKNDALAWTTKGPLILADLSLHRLLAPPASSASDNFDFNCKHAPFYIRYDIVPYVANGDPVAAASQILNWFSDFAHGACARKTRQIERKSSLYDAFAVPPQLFVDATANVLEATEPRNDALFVEWRFSHCELKV